MVFLISLPLRVGVLVCETIFSAPAFPHLGHVLSWRCISQIGTTIIRRITPMVRRTPHRVISSSVLSAFMEPSNMATTAFVPSSMPRSVLPSRKCGIM